MVIWPPASAAASLAGAMTAATPASATAKSNAARSFMEVPPLRELSLLSLLIAALRDWTPASGSAPSRRYFDLCHNTASACLTSRSPFSGIIRELMLTTLRPLIGAMHKYALFLDVSREHGSSVSTADTPQQKKLSQHHRSFREVER